MFLENRGGYGIPGLLYGCPMHDVVWLGSEAALHINLHWGTIKEKPKDQGKNAG
jgi:hypothetical protein